MLIFVIYQLKLCTPSLARSNVTHIMVSSHDDCICFTFICQVEESDRKALNFMGLMLLPVSLVCLLIVIVTYTTIRYTDILVDWYGNEVEWVWE